MATTMIDYIDLSFLIIGFGIAFIIGCSIGNLISKRMGWLIVPDYEDGFTKEELEDLQDMCEQVIGDNENGEADSDRKPRRVPLGEEAAESC